MDTLKTMRKKAEKLLTPSPRRLSPRSSREDTAAAAAASDISGPTNVVRHHHATVDEHGNLDGLPNDMKMMLQVSAKECILQHCNLALSL